MVHYGLFTVYEILVFSHLNSVLPFLIWIYCDDEKSNLIHDTWKALSKTLLSSLLNLLFMFGSQAIYLYGRH